MQGRTCLLYTSTVCELILPLILRYITNQGLKDLASLTVQTIVGIGVLYFALRIVDGLASFYMAYTGHVMGAAIETDMRQMCIRDSAGTLQQDTFQEGQPDKGINQFKRTAAGRQDLQAAVPSLFTHYSSNSFE